MGLLQLQLRTRDAYDKEKMKKWINRAHLQNPSFAPTSNHHITMHLDSFYDTLMMGGYA